MNKQIWKFSTLIANQFDPNFTITMPKGTEILTVQIDQKDNHPCIWALVDPQEREKEQRYFELFGTGHDIHYDMSIERKYIGSYQYQRGEFVGHILKD